MRQVREVDHWESFNAGDEEQQIKTLFRCSQKNLTLKRELLFFGQESRIYSY